MSRRSTRLHVVANTREASVLGQAVEETESIPETSPATEAKRKARKRKPKESVEAPPPSLTPVDDEYQEEPPKKKRKPRVPKPEPVYIIPDVEKRSTTFHGRLGYACLNTILRTQKPPVFCSRTCRIDTIKKNGMKFVHDLGVQNAKDLSALIEWNEQHNIKFMRVSSEMFPFASHPEYGYNLADVLGAPEALKKAGDLANKYGHRLTTHPGQFTQLGSPRDGVVTAAIRDLNYHASMFELMGIGKDGVMIIHGGGVYGDKPSTLSRLKASIAGLEEDGPIRQRLVLENDELCYSAEDLLPLCEELSIPLVFDYHHHALNPGEGLSIREIVDRANAIFKRKGIRPKQHLSEPRPGAETLMERRAHADRCQSLPDELDDDMDLMIEAKDKEQAVFHLYRIYDLHPTIHASLRPPNENQSKETNGRKTSKKSKVQLADEDVDEDTGNGVVVDGEEGSTVPPAVQKAPKPQKRRAKPDNDVLSEGKSAKASTRKRKHASALDVREGQASEGGESEVVTPKRKKARKGVKGPASSDAVEMDIPDASKTRKQGKRGVSSKA
ncbi:UV-endonuclease UvdE [Cylindrobasidium torrendii FP15055 ss-10]|uniref:UV-endonuclease UvdE n=1 Tax=Cylindrobasidium torrendii FP15055 ss-10 TaxID=1314674 RepID=A0A0D7BPA7_9AGAR|nr:UV-endonuclease UvdE [Cylindrobasidium torrendii FP15055 ss-10]